MKPRPLAVAREAEVEGLEAAEWYENRSQGLFGAQDFDRPPLQRPAAGGKPGGDGERGAGRDAYGERQGLELAGEVEAAGDDRPGEGGGAAGGGDAGDQADEGVLDREVAGHPPPRHGQGLE